MPKQKFQKRTGYSSNTAHTAAFISQQYVCQGRLRQVTERDNTWQDTVHA